MADPHITINIDSQPSLECPNPAYNCVEYCFDCTQYQTQVGTRAEFRIEVPFGTTDYGAFSFVVAGQNFFTGIINSYPSVETSPGPYTQLEFAENFKASFESSNYLFNNFTFQISGNELIATARKVGELDNFDFDFSNFAPNPLVSSTNGTNDEYLERYKLNVEIWRSFNGATVGDAPISTESYTPNNDGTFCINIGEKIAPLLETRYIFDIIDTFNQFGDTTIIDTFIIRYGEIFADNIDDCNSELRSYASTDEIKVINSAFQKENAADQITKMCEGDWMTNMPQYTQVCENTDVALWINLLDILEGLGGGEALHQYLIITYTDGTTSTHVSPFTINPALAPLGIYIIPYTAFTVNSFADPLKVVRSFECSMIVQPTNTVYASQHFRRVSCCKGDITFQFLNEFGGYDPIIFTQITAIDLEQESTPFEGFLGCDQNGLRGGVDIVGQTAGDVYTVTSKFLNNYNNIRWIREFLASPLKYVFMEVDGVEIQSKIISLSNTTRYFSQDNTLLITLEFTLNESLNLHKN